MNELFVGYIEDLKENLINLDEALIDMENGNRDCQLINRIFRVAHTIKGNSAAMEFYKIEKVMHTAENILQQVRSGERMLTEEIIGILYSCHDFLEDCLEVLQKVNSDKSIEIEEILKKFQSISKDKTMIEGSENEIENNIQEFEISLDLKRVLEENYEHGLKAFTLSVIIDEKCVMKSVRAWLILDLVSKYASVISSIPKRLCEIDINKTDFTFDDNVIRLLIITENDVDCLIKALLKVNEVQQVSFEEFKMNIKESPQEIHEVNSTLEENIKDAQNHSVNEKQDRGFIRVPVGKVDGLMDMLGELLILNSQFSQLAEECFSNNSTMTNTLSRTSKLIKEIQALSMSLRMIEVKPTLHKLHRIARDTAVELNKKIAISIEGEETEIDRSAAEKIFDPLMHLVRNAVSHGIEEEEERKRSQKNLEGKISIKAYCKRGNVFFEVADDGRGIDVKKVLRKAIDLKMAEENHDYSEDEIIKFIFKPGFSTQDEINNISGRGVGMNVVDEVISHMGGKIEITNNPGHGCNFIIRIPMNLAVVNGTIIEVKEERFIIPTLFIKEFFIANDSSYISIKGERKAVRIREKIIPVVDAGKIFYFQEDDAAAKRKEVVILEMDQKFLAFPVDKIISRQEIVSKPLDSGFGEIPYASGAAILGDGNVSLILDAEAIFKMAGL